MNPSGKRPPSSDHEEVGAGTTEAAAQAAAKVLAGLPAQFLALVLLNALMLGVMGYLNHHEQQARERLLTPLIMECLRGRPQ